MSEQKSIFITGAASGIGLAAAKLFSERGWFVGLADVNEAGIAAAAGALPADRTFTAAFDVRDAAAWTKAVDAFSAGANGRMDVLFNNAGIGRPGWFEDIAQEEAALEIDVNLKGVVNGVYAALPALKAVRGRIINTASAAGLYGAPRLAVYSATKFAVRGLTEALDIEFARHGVRCICLMPWFVETAILDARTARSNRQLRDDAAGTTIYPVGAAADAVWNAAHTDDLYVFVGKEAKNLRFAARFMPNMLRKRLLRAQRERGTM
ncbi:MAG: SDR family oxidoreductase [Alphaproteobacteria bacterium]|nr:SDR family oxidoreductase [Alphaproteobacteria bacterium]